MKVQVQFFRTTTGIQSGPDAFDESRFFMTFLIILGDRERLCFFRLEATPIDSGYLATESGMRIIFEFMISITHTKEQK